MTFTKEQLRAVMTDTNLNRCVEGLRQLLVYPVKERASENSRFWYLPPGLITPEEMPPVQLRGRYQ